MRVGHPIIVFAIVTAGLWVLAHTLWPRIPMWPFLLAGFLFAPVLTDLMLILEFVVDSIRFRTGRGAPR